MQNTFGVAPIDSQRLPGVAHVGSGPLAAASAVIAGQLLRRAATRLPLRLVDPGGAVIGTGDATSPTLLINRPHAPARRIGRLGLIGFGESYMAGEWVSDDLAGLLTVFATATGEAVNGFRGPHVGSCIWLPGGRVPVGASRCLSVDGCRQPGLTKVRAQPGAAAG